MSLDGIAEDGGGWSLPDLLAFVRNMKAGPQPADDPIAQYLAARAQDARLPPTGGLFGSGYAAYMADNAPPMPTSGALDASSAGDPALWLARFTADGQDASDAEPGAASGGASALGDDGGDQPPTQPAPMVPPQADGAPTGSGVSAAPAVWDGMPPQLDSPVATPPDLLTRAEPVSAGTFAGAAGPAAPAPSQGVDPQELAGLKALLIREEGIHTDVYEDNQQHLTTGIGH